PSLPMVFLVDDEQAERFGMRILLEIDNHTIVEAGNYQDALKVFETNRHSIELLIVDISLPGGDGCELAIAFRKLNPDLRILFVSGHVGAEVLKYYGLGLSETYFLRKPFAAAEL